MEVKLKRPKTLSGGEAYIWRENTGLAGNPSTQAVTFVSYDPCPAFAIVRDAEGKRWRCPRDEIFLAKTTQATVIAK